MPIVKMDRKGRIQLPSRVRREWNLRPRQPLMLSIRAHEMSVSKIAKAAPKSDPLLRDILEKPIRSKRQVTREMLEKIQDEMWSL